MPHRLAARRADDGGFTLIELLVVIIIIGILAAIAIPVFLNQRKKGWDAQAKSDSRNLASMQEAYVVDHDNYIDFDSTAASPASEFDGYRDSDQVVTKAKANSAFGYCIISQSRSGDFFVYDSLNGGLDNSPKSSIPSSWTPGTACAVGQPTMP